MKTPEPVPHFFDASGWFALSRSLGLNPWRQLAGAAVACGLIGAILWLVLT
jgi:hypothetical protein